ncbi:terpenoid synthase [Trichoderma reesei RUT C-30]|uniref:Terpene synthase n=1 Tax=Hypocrea jecorina (strain ATCC 56765 / BCRC 32924 / NRRL 11460 / Rut C-30) TaxID=1344414 RepID=A0A024S600_HYPJR|nr:terpenoid synthase [Trichoderma reesei RUT C-30]
MAPGRYALRANELASMLSGSTLTIPNLKVPLAKFARGQSKYTAEIRRWVDRLVEENIHDRRKCIGVKRCDFGYLAACCFPDADWEQLKAAAAFLVWIFTWDDIIDHGEDTSGIISNGDRARVFCQQSLEYISQKLELGGSCEEIASQIAPSMSMFDETAGPLMSVNWSQRQTQRLYSEIEHYVKCCLIEHLQQEDDSIPSQEEYTTMRFGTSGITPGIAICEFTRDISLPDEIVESAPMKVIWREITRLCMMINDIYSCQKELRSGVIQNIIPVIAYASGTDDITTVTQEFMDIFQTSVNTFEEAYQLLKALASPDPKLSEDIQKYIQNCQTITTGLLEWMLRSERYSVGKHLQADGSALVPLIYDSGKATAGKA